MKTAMQKVALLILLIVLVTPAEAQDAAKWSATVRSGGLFNARIIVLDAEGDSLDMNTYESVNYDLYRRVGSTLVSSFSCDDDDGFDCTTTGLQMLAPADSLLCPTDECYHELKVRTAGLPAPSIWLAGPLYVRSSGEPGTGSSNDITITLSESAEVNVTVGSEALATSLAPGWLAGLTEVGSCDSGSVIPIGVAGLWRKIECGNLPSGGGGSSLVLDLGRDGTEESSALLGIKTTGDDNSVFTEPNTDTLLVDLSQNWPTADNAAALTDGDKGSFTCSSGTCTIDDEVVTLAKMQHIVSARLLGRTTAGTGDVETITAAQLRTLLGVEDGADVTDATNVAAAGAHMSGGTDVPVADGGTGSSTAAGARAALGVDAAGTDNSTPVTLAGSLDYITLSGQEITRGAINLATDVAGALPATSLSGTLADNRVAESNVTQHEAALSINESQIPDLDHLTASEARTALVEDGAAEMTGESLGTACTSGQVLESDGSGGLDCATPSAGGDFTSTTTHEQIPFERGGAVAGTDSLQWDGSQGALRATNLSFEGRFLRPSTGAYYLITLQSGVYGMFATGGGFPYGGMVAETPSLTNPTIGPSIGSFNNVGIGGTSDLSFITAGASRMYIAAAGNVGIAHTSPDTALDISGALTKRALSSDPADPDAEAMVCWLSDGTGTGDPGDYLCKINIASTVKTVTLIDYSSF